jgi:hypothetical protein
MIYTVNVPPSRYQLDIVSWLGMELHAQFCLSVLGICVELGSAVLVSRCASSSLSLKDAVSLKPSSYIHVYVDLSSLRRGVWYHKKGETMGGGTTRHHMPSNKSHFPNPVHEMYYILLSHWPKGSPEVSKHYKRLPVLLLTLHDLMVRFDCWRHTVLVPSNVGKLSCWQSGASSLLSSSHSSVLFFKLFFFCILFLRLYYFTS